MPNAISKTFKYEKFSSVSKFSSLHLATIRKGKVNCATLKKKRFAKRGKFPLTIRYASTVVFTRDVKRSCGTYGAQKPGPVEPSSAVSYAMIVIVAVSSESWAGDRDFNR